MNNFPLLDLCDAATDSQAFIARSLHAMYEAEAGCEDAIRAEMPVKLVGHTSSLARLANRSLYHLKVSNTELHFNCC